MARKRPKDLVKEYLRHLDREGMKDETRNEFEYFAQHWLFSFAYWIEGQDRGPCRYHIAEPSEVPCPFINDL